MTKIITMINVKGFFQLSLAVLAFSLTSIASSNELMSPVDRWLSDSSVKLVDKGTKSYQWKFAHPVPPVSLLPPIWQKGFDWLAVASDSKFNLKVYGGGALYGVAGGFKAIRAGVADYGTCYTVAESRGFELLKTLQLPYIAPDNPYLNARIINELAPKWFKSEFERRGVYPAHIVPVRPLSLMSKTPIVKPEDLRGKKIVSFMNAPGAAEALGYSEVRLPFPEIYTALQQGVVDGVLWIDMGFVPFKIFEQAKYYTAIKVAPATLETCFNRRSFDRLSKPMKQLVYDSQQKMGVAIARETELFAVKASSILKSNGVTIIELSDEQLGEWQSAYQPVVESYLATCEKAGKDCRSLINDVNKLKEKYKDTSNEELMRLAIDEPVQGIIEF